MMSTSGANVAMATAGKLFTAGLLFARDALRKTTHGERPMTYQTTYGTESIVREVANGPFEGALKTGRLHEREDVLTYLTTLAVTTNVEELWEAVNYIKEGSHVR